jgi:alkylhydroperoxidase family enzyme
MKYGEAREIAANPSGVVLGDKQVQQLVRLASDFVARPLEFTAAEIGELARTAGSEEAYLEVTGVIAGFSFITRMADALGVDPQIPTWLTHYQPMRGVVSQVSALVVRCAVDLEPRCYPKEGANDNLRLLDEYHQRLGLGPLPSFFARLTSTPHLLWSEREFFEAIIEVYGADHGRFMAAGQIVLEKVSCSTLRSRIDDWFHRSGLGSPENVLGQAKYAEMVGFAEEMTNRACSLPSARVGKSRRSAPAQPSTTGSPTSEGVNKLRSCGLTDKEILDWAFAIALWHAIGRTERLLESK